MKQPNLLAKNPKRKFSAKQIAAQKRFAVMAKAGKFRKRTKHAKRNPRVSGKWVVVWRTPWEGPQAKVFHGTPGGLNRASKFATAKQYDMIAARGGLDTAWGQKAYRELRDAFQSAFEGREKSALVKFSKDLEIGFKFDTSETIKARRNPVKAGARRSPPKRNPAEKFLIRGQRPVKSGYIYYYLRGDQFVKETRYADKFNKAEGEKQMYAIQPKLPAAITSITLVKA